MGVRPIAMVVLALTLPSAVCGTCQDSPAPSKPLQTPLPIKSPYKPLVRRVKSIHEGGIARDWRSTQGNFAWRETYEGRYGDFLENLDVALDLENK